MPKNHVSINLVDVVSFSHDFSLDEDLYNRISILFWLKLYIFVRTRTMDVFPIIDEVKSLENISHFSMSGQEYNSVTKDSGQFKHPPLRGLWHKHFFTAQFLAQNILKAHAKKGAGKRRMEKFFTEHEGAEIDQTILGLLADEMTTGAFKDTLDQKKLTGEWVVFSHNSGKNYYLTCSFHNRDHWLDYEEIKQFCVPEFPHLRVWAALQFGLGRC